MAGIQDFISMATSSLGADENAVKGATGGLLDFVKDKVDGDDFQGLLGAMPGASDLVGKAAASDGGGGGGGLLGGVAKLAGGALGGKLGGAAGLLGALGGSGLDTGQIGKFVGQFLGFAKENVAGDLLGRILDAVPDLKKLAG